MIKNIFKARTGVILAGAIALTGCDWSPTQDVTDKYAQNLLIKTEDDASLVKQYHPMINEDGKHLGILFIGSIDQNPETNITCANYVAWTKGGDISKVSKERKACVSSTLTLNG